jgi:hypothetical protein
MPSTMTRLSHPRPNAPRGYASHLRPLTYAALAMAVFVSTVIVLAVKAGTSAAMLTTLFVLVLASTACGLWGTAMAVREAHHHIPSEHGIDLPEGDASAPASTPAPDPAAR